jgi:hypothetical protein
MPKTCTGFIHPVTKRCRKTCAQRKLVEHPVTKKCVKPCLDNKTRKASTGFKCRLEAKPTTEPKAKAVTPKVAAPKVATPKIAASKVATPKIAASKVATPKIAAPTPNVVQGIVIIEYSERSFAVAGETKPIKDTLKTLGGKFNAHLKHPATQLQFVGWIFPLYKRTQVEAALKLPTNFKPPLPIINQQERDDLAVIIVDRQQEQEKRLAEEALKASAEQAKKEAEEVKKAAEEAKKAADNAKKAADEAKKAADDAKKKAEQEQAKHKAEAEAAAKAAQKKAEEAKQKADVAAKKAHGFLSSLERYAKVGREKPVANINYLVSRNYFADFLYQKYAPPGTCGYFDEVFTLKKVAKVTDLKPSTFVNLHEVCTRVVSWVKKCAKPDMPYLVHNFSLLSGKNFGHANFILLNLIERKLYRFDPWGQKTRNLEQVDWAMQYITDYLNKEWVKPGESKIKYVSPKESCPAGKVFQMLQDEYSQKDKTAVGREKQGLCVYWSYLIMEAVLRNPTMRYEDVLKHCNNFFANNGEQTIAVMRGYTNFVTTCVQADKKKYKYKKPEAE